MKRIDFTQPGGFPMSQDRLKEMQEYYRTAINALATAVGDLVIVSGCIQIGDVVTSGWVILFGELLPFVGGTVKPYISRKETVTAAPQYADGNNKNAVYEIYATFDNTFSVSSNSAIWANMPRIQKLIDHTKNKNNPHEVTKLQVELGNVDNTSDNNKPVSIAMQAALDTKVDKELFFSNEPENVTFNPDMPRNIVLAKSGVQTPNIGWNDFPSWGTIMLIGCTLRVTRTGGFYTMLYNTDQVKAVYDFIKVPGDGLYLFTKYTGSLASIH